MFEYGLNFSVHNPICLLLNTKIECQTVKINVKDGKRKNNIAWHNVSEVHKQEYIKALDINLSHICRPDFLGCDDALCSNHVHIAELDMYCQSIIDSCIKAGEVFPRRKLSKKLPYWGTRVKCYKDEAMFWKEVWINNGKPSSGFIFDYMKKSKLQYHYAVRRLKRNSDNLRKCRMADAIENNKSRDFWQEVKKINNSGFKQTDNIGNKTKAADIAALFAEKYRSLYNSVESDPSRIENVLEANEQNIYSPCVFHDVKIELNDIRKALRKVQIDKADDNHELFSNHLLYASDHLYTKLCHLFNAMLLHGHVPECILNSSIISIPKDVRGDLSSDDNYRGISLCSSLFKLFEIIITIKQGRKLETSDMQYAYKSGHSTTMCTMVFKDVINHYFHNNSNVYCCFIDASKAFDRIRHDLLFEMLMERNLNPLMLRIIIDCYKRQTAQTCWLQEKSDKFLCSNGVRQGGILSPLFYSIYNDVLLNRIKENGDGCWIGHQFYGALSYADDLCILSPTITGMKKMLNICEGYGREYDVLFNPRKTKCMLFTREACDVDAPQVHLCGKQLEWVCSFKYLGNWVTPDLSEKVEIDKKCGVFYGNCNYLSATFRNVGNQNILKLFNSYCCHYYGSQSWKLNDKNISKIYVAWNKAVRHLCRLSYRTHTFFLPYVTNSLYVKDQLYIRSANMIMAMLKSPNESVRMLAKSNIDRKTSIIGANWNEILTFFSVYEFPCTVKKVREHELYNKFTPECGIMLELLEIRDNNYVLNGFTKHEIDEMLNDICTM
jgi:hypothetical protein